MSRLARLGVTRRSVGGALTEVGELGLGGAERDPFVVERSEMLLKAVVGVQKKRKLNSARVILELNLTGGQKTVIFKIALVDEQVHNQLVNIVTSLERIVTNFFLYGVHVFSLIKVGKLPI